MTIDAPTQPERVRIARELRGLTQKQTVAAMANPISPSALSQIEGGRIQPTETTLHGLAEALDVPVAYFRSPWPKLASRDQAVFFRHLRATPVRQQRRATAIATVLMDLVAAIQTEVQLPDVDLPDLGAHSHHDAMDEAAMEVREAWGLGQAPVKSVVRELETHGVVVARLLLGHRDVDAFSARLGDRPIVMLADDKQSYVRSRFDAAHELGHLVLHRQALPGSQTVEAQAHSFASSFLLPREAALRELPRRLTPAGWARLAENKRRWGISIAAQLYVGKALDIYRSDEYVNAMKYMSSRGWRRVEPGDREMGPPEPPQLLEKALLTIRDETGQSVAEFVESTGLPVDDTLELIERATDARPAISL